MAKKNIHIVLLTVILLVSCAILGTSLTLSWLGGSNELKPIIASTVITQYFESGTGTKDDPFIIHSPRHLYNLAWLQYMGQFNTLGSDDNYKQYYFELCDGNNSWAKNHSDSGLGDAGLDMEGWVLPPIGTAQYPFLGNFNGNGRTISNLKISNKYSDLSDQALPQYSTEGVFASFDAAAYDAANQASDIVGLFGVVGSINGSAGTVNVGNTSYSYSSQANEVKNLYVNNLTVESQTKTSLIGIVAGYVNGTLSNIGVIDSSLNLASTGPLNNSQITGKISNYTLVGYCTDPYLGIAGVAERTIEGPEEGEATEDLDDSDMGFGNAWGGSIDMKSMFTRLGAIRNDAVNYPLASEDIVVYRDSATGEITNISTTISRSVRRFASRRDNNNNTVTVNSYYGDNGGLSVTFVNNTERYIYLTRSDEVMSQNTTTNTYVEDGSYFISDGNNYLSVINGQIANELDAYYAAAWYFEGTSVYTKQGGSVHYLNIAKNEGGEYVLVLNDQQSTIWNKGTSGLSCVVDGTRKYLCFEEGEWTISEKILQYVITDGKGHYLQWTGSSFANSDEENATRWSAKSGTLFIAGSNNALSIDKSGISYATVSVSLTTADKDSAISWSNDGLSIYCSVDGVPFYISFSEGAWKAVRDPDPIRRIHSGNNYLSVESGQSGVVLKNEANPADLDSVAEWTFQARTSTEYIVYTTVRTGGSSVKYYLTGAGNLAENATGRLSLTTIENNAQVWIWDSYSDTLKYAVNTDKTVYSYLRFGASGWELYCSPVYYIISDNSAQNFLSYDGSGITNKTSADEATWWNFQNKNNYAPASGKISVKGLNRYLAINSGYNGVNIATSSTADRTTWTVNGKRLQQSRYYVYTYSLNYTSPRWTASGALFGRGAQSLILTPIQEYDKLKFDVLTPDMPEAHSSETSGIPTLMFLAAGRTTSDGGIQKNPLAAVTYFPLTSMDAYPYSALPSNTGYVVSGMNEGSGLHADIRVSRYGLSDITKSVSSTRTYNGNDIKILACDAGDNGAFKIISDPSLNSAQSPTGNVGAISAYSPVSDFGLQVMEKGLKKFRSAKEGFDELFSDGTNYLYGLHFMNAQISADRKITATKAVINGKTYANYELPEDCIDCNLRTQGYINFFAGTYFSRTVDSFFSLHEITRDKNTHEITDIKEIDKIYKNNNGGEYYYQYVGDSAPSGKNYTLIFDMSWVTNMVPNSDGDYVQKRALEQNALYYFEIPVNAGEYALGSVSGGTGAYLIYLDISANAVFYEKKPVVTTDSSILTAYEYPLGVDVVKTSSDAIGVVPSAVASIKNGSTGLITLSRSDVNEVQFALSDGATYDGIGSTYVARLNTEEEYGADLTIGKVRSVYVSKSALEASGESLGDLNYATMAKYPKITEANQYITADVVLTGEGFTISPTPLIHAEGTILSKYYNYYLVENGESTLVNSSVDNPQTIPLAPIIVENGPQQLYDIVPARMMLKAPKMALRSSAPRSGVSTLSLQPTDEIRPWINSAPPEDCEGESQRRIVVLPEEPQEDITLDSVRRELVENIDSMLADAPDSDMVEMLSIDEIRMFFDLFRDEDAIVDAFINRLAAFKDVKQFRLAKSKLEAIFADDEEILARLRAIEEPKKETELYAFITKHILAPQEGEMYRLPAASIEGTFINVSLYEAPFLVRWSDAIDEYSWGKEFPEGVIALAIPQEAIGSIEITGDGSSLPVFVRSDGTSYRPAYNGNGTISINPGFLEAASWCKIDQYGNIVGSKDEPVVVGPETDEPAVDPTEELPDEPGEDVPDEPAEDLPENPAEDVPGEPVEDLPEEPAEDIPSEEPTVDEPEEPAEETPAEPVEDTPVEPEEVPTEPVEDVSEEPSEEAPAEDSIEEPTEDLPEEPAEDTPAEPEETPVPTIPVVMFSLVNLDIETPNGPILFDNPEIIIPEVPAEEDPAEAPGEEPVEETPAESAEETPLESEDIPEEPIVDAPEETPEEDREPVAPEEGNEPTDPEESVEEEPEETTEEPETPTDDPQDIPSKEPVEPSEDDSEENPVDPSEEEPGEEPEDPSDEDDSEEEPGEDSEEEEELQITYILLLSADRGEELGIADITFEYAASRPVALLSSNNVVAQLSCRSTEEFASFAVICSEGTYEIAPIFESEAVDPEENPDEDPDELEDPDEEDFEDLDDPDDVDSDNPEEPDEDTPDDEAQETPSEEPDIPELPPVDEPETPSAEEPADEPQDTPAEEPVVPEMPQPEEPETPEVPPVEEPELPSAEDNPEETPEETLADENAAA